MSRSSLPITPFPYRTASEGEFAALHRLAGRLQAEQLPDDPPTPLEEHIRQWQEIPDFVEVFVWVVRQEGSSELAARAKAMLARMEENAHLMQFEIEVLPEFRRQGIGRRMLASIVEAAQRENRRLLIAGTSGLIPAGEAFMQSLGAHKALESHTNQLKMSDLDRDLIRRWIERAQERASEFELGFWDGAYPEDQIVAIAALYEVMNSQPLGSLEVEDFHFTPAHLRQMEQVQFATGNERWTLYAREKATGAFAGFTDVSWNTNRPDLLHQGNTGVWPAYRGKGLGRWLKAAMLERVIADRPQVNLVRTGNADMNAAMLHINHELGFQPYQSQSLWQVETEKVDNYLRNKTEERE